MEGFSSDLVEIRLLNEFAIDSAVRPVIFLARGGGSIQRRGQEFNMPEKGSSHSLSMDRFRRGADPAQTPALHLKIVIFNKFIHNRKGRSR